VRDAPVRRPEGKAVIEGIQIVVLELYRPSDTAVLGLVDAKIRWVPGSSNRHQVGNSGAESLDIAELQLKAADTAFSAGEAEKGQAAVTDVVSYAERAGEAARSSRKHIKNAEIHIRKIARRLDDIRRTLNFEDRPPVQAAVDRLEHVRTELLARMFEHK
jgi:hypothetical protein